jgi:oxygen-dependent protoporphyrinogen oxidase
MKIVIAGGGISGLSAAWFARKRYPEAEIVVLEKTQELGGWMKTQREQGFFFETGPRTFSWDRTPVLRELIQAVGLEKEIILSSKAASFRYLWSRGQLRSLRSVMLRSLPALCMGALRKAPIHDVSIYEFASKKFGTKVAEELFDPVTLGIYAGDIRKLSMQACFPHFGLPGGRLFSLKRGLDQLTTTLARSCTIVRDCEVECFCPEGLVAQGRIWEADKVISALPVHQVWPEMPTVSLWRVFLVYGEPVLSKRGFGYLVPTKNQESILGMVWDSEIFPQQNLALETRMTAMVRDGVSDPVEVALTAAREHLGIVKKPLFLKALRAESAIPQFEVGYSERLQTWKQKMQQRFPKVAFAGNYLQGASVEACIRSAKVAVECDTLAS